MMMVVSTYVAGDFSGSGMICCILEISKNNSLGKGDVKKMSVNTSVS